MIDLLNNSNKQLFLYMIQLPGVSDEFSDRARYRQTQLIFPGNRREKNEEKEKTGFGLPEFEMEKIRFPYQMGPQSIGLVPIR